MWTHYEVIAQERGRPRRRVPKMRANSPRTRRSRKVLQLQLTVMQPMFDTIVWSIMKNEK